MWGLSHCLQAAASQSYSALASHLGVVANVAVRNAGSWAGNLMLAHTYPNFPSDVFTIMAAAGATVQVCTRDMRSVCLLLACTL